MSPTVNAPFLLLSLAVAVTSVLGVSVRQTRAEGAVAIGTTGNIEKDGLAVGRSRNDDTQQHADQKALQACKDFKAAPKRTRDKCRVVARFKNECAASAMDPKAGTPGFGYAVAATSSVAGERAMLGCKATAGGSREKYCAMDQMICDGSAK